MEHKGVYVMGWQSQAVGYLKQLRHLQDGVGVIL